MPFKIVRNDITKMNTDAIVNTANYEPAYGSGTDFAIYQAAGEKKLLSARKKIGRIDMGKAAVTKAYGLQAKYIIHTVGPVWNEGSDEEKKVLKDCYKNSLLIAKEKGCQSIAFPLISSGNDGFPKEIAMKIALEEIESFLMENEMMIFLVLFDQESVSLSGKLFEEIDEYIDANYVEEKLNLEKINTTSILSRSQAAGIVPAANRPFGRFPFRNKKVAKSEIAYNEQQEDELSDEPSPMRKTASEQMAMVGAAFEKKTENQMPEMEIPKPTRTLDDVVLELGETFQERLLRLIDLRQMTNAQVYKKANLDRKLFSKILCNPSYKPKKRTVLAFAIALELSLDETKDLLARAEYALSPSSKFDLIIRYFIEREVYDIYAINMALFEHDEQMLGE
ncbi:MAG: macro domain-containing protein [Lachnospiraceae bacterium]|nr:macro domain-containing protein [Lachnospiraceae bacterium]